MARKAKSRKATTRKVAKKVISKKVAKKTRARKSRSAAMARPRYCYLITADPRWVERCEYGPDGRCNLNCTRIPASQVPMSATVQEREA